MRRVVVRDAPETVSAHEIKSSGPFDLANALAFGGGRLAIAYRSNVAIVTAEGLIQWVKNCAPDTAWVSFVPGRSSISSTSHGDARGACTRVVELGSGQSTVVRGPVCVARDGRSIAANRRAYRVGDRTDVLSLEVALQAAPATARDAFTADDMSFMFTNEVVNLGTDTHRARALVASPDRSLHAIGHDHSPTVDVYRADGSKHLELHLGGFNALALAFSPSGERLITGAVHSGPLKVWNVADGTEVASTDDFAPQRPGTTAVFVNEDVVAYVAIGRVARLWRLSTGERLTVEANSQTKWAVYADDGRYDGSPAGLKELDVFEGDKRSRATEPTAGLLGEFLSP